MMICIQKMYNYNNNLLMYPYIFYNLLVLLTNKKQWKILLTIRYIVQYVP